MEAFCTGFNHVICASLIPLCLSPTCKKSCPIVEFNINTVGEFRTSKNEGMHMGLNGNWPLVTASSDGAGYFCSGVGQVLNQDFPKNMCDMYVSEDNILLSPLFNLIGGAKGTIRSCDPDCLGTSFCAHRKSILGYAIGVYTSTESNIA